MFFRFIILHFSCSDSKVQQESIWVLINVAFGNSSHVRAIVEAGVTPKLIRLMDHENRTVVRNATWALANMCGDGVDTCTHLINEGIVVKLVKLIEVGDTSLETLRLIAWLCLNLSRHYSPVSLTKISTLVQPLLRLLETHTDKRITIDTCTFFGNILSVSQRFGFPIAIFAVFAVMSKILDRTQSYAIESALTTVRVVAKSEAIAQREQIFSCGIAAKVANLIHNRNDNISYLSMNIFRLLANGSFSVSYIPKMFQLNVLDKVSMVFVNVHGTIRTKREAIALLKAFVIKGGSTTIQKIFEDEYATFWTSFCQLLSHRNPNLVMDCLRLLDAIANRYTTRHILGQFYNFGIVEKVSGLMDHVCDEISTLTIDLLHSYDYPDLPYSPEMYGSAEE